jgi:hypothetical protein
VDLDIVHVRATTSQQICGIPIVCILDAYRTPAWIGTSVPYAGGSKVYPITDNPKVFASYYCSSCGEFMDVPYRSHVDGEWYHKGCLPSDKAKPKPKRRGHWKE